MQNRTILTTFTIFLILAFASGLENRKTRRRRNRRLMGPGPMEDMMTVEPDDEAEAEADAAGETDVCKTSCKKWEGNANKYDACIAECDGVPEPSDRRTRRNRRNRQLMMGGLMDEEQDVANDEADDEADCCELDCEVGNPEANMKETRDCVDACIAAGNFAAGC